MTTSKRNLSFEITRAMAIYLVIIGHSMTGLWGTWQSNFVFAANLPVFFIISGYFYHSKKMKDVIQTGINTNSLVERLCTFTQPVRHVQVHYPMVLLTL